METMTINELKEKREDLKKSILQLIKDFEDNNPEIEITVSTKRAYSVDDSEPSHTVDVITFIK